MPRPISPDELHSYDEWQRIGYQVQRGEHHVERGSLGVPLFAGRQVAPRRNFTAPIPRSTYQRTPTRIRQRDRDQPGPQPYVRSPPPPPRVEIRHAWITGDRVFTSEELQRVYTGYHTDMGVLTNDVPAFSTASSTSSVTGYRHYEISPPKLPQELIDARKEVWEIAQEARQAELALRQLDRKFRRLVPADEAPSGFVKLLKGEPNG